MKKTKITLMLIYGFILMILIVSLSSCTENSRAKHWGGNAEINLPKGKKISYNHMERKSIMVFNA